MSAPVDWAAVAAGLQKNYPGLSNIPRFGGSVAGAPPALGGKQPPNDFGYTSQASGVEPGSPDYNTGVQLMGPLSIPKEWGISAGSEFTWALQGDSGTDEAGVSYTGHKAVQMTLAGGLAWLRDLSVHNRDQYNTVVGELVQAGYLTAADARLNRYTTQVGNAFVKSAVDVIGTNNDASGGGAVTTWQDNIDQLIEGRKSMGQLNSDGSPGSGSGSGGGAQAPIEQDQFTDPATVRHYIDAAAKNVLGRKLTDGEAAQFAAVYHGQEAAWNKQKFASDTAQFNNQASSSTDHPDTSVAAEQYVNNDQSLAPERTQQLVGSYVGVLRNMFGLGSGGVSGAVS